MKKFWTAFIICWLVFALFNALFSIEPTAQVRLSYTHRVGFPFPVLVERVQHTASGHVVTLTTDHRPWGHWVNVGFWFCLSYGFARWVDRNGAAWWRGKSKPHEPRAA